MGFSMLSGFFSDWKNIVMAGLVAVIIGLFVYTIAQRAEIVGLKETIADQRIELADAAKVTEQLKTDVADRDLQIINMETTVNLLNASIQQKDSGIAALQAQVDKLLKDSNYWWNMAKKKDKIIKDLTEADAVELIKNGKVIDESSSFKAVSEMNSVLFKSLVDER